MPGTCRSSSASPSSRSLAYVGTSLLIDLASPAIDPRLRAGVHDDPRPHGAAPLDVVVADGPWQRFSACGPRGSGSALAAAARGDSRWSGRWCCPTRLPDYTRQLAAPAPEHWLGTDQSGRDLLSRTVAGARTSLGAALLVMGIAGVVGLLVRDPRGRDRRSCRRRRDPGDRRPARAALTRDDPGRRRDARSGVLEPRAGDVRDELGRHRPARAQHRARRRAPTGRGRRPNGRHPAGAVPRSRPRRPAVACTSSSLPPSVSPTSVARPRRSVVPRTRGAATDRRVGQHARHQPRHLRLRAVAAARARLRLVLSVAAASLIGDALRDVADPGTPHDRPLVVEELTVTYPNGPRALDGVDPCGSRPGNAVGRRRPVGQRQDDSGARGARSAAGRRPPHGRSSGRRAGRARARERRCGDPGGWSSATCRRTHSRPSIRCGPSATTSGEAWTAHGRTPPDGAVHHRAVRRRDRRRRAAGRAAPAPLVRRHAAARHAGRRYRHSPALASPTSRPAPWTRSSPTTSSPDRAPTCGAVLVISHDLALVARHTDPVHVLDAGPSGGGRAGIALLRTTSAEERTRRAGGRLGAGSAEVSPARRAGRLGRRGRRGVAHHRYRHGHDPQSPTCRSRSAPARSSASWGSRAPGSRRSPGSLGGMERPDAGPVRLAGTTRWNGHRLGGPDS